MAGPSLPGVGVSLACGVALSGSTPDMPWAGESLSGVGTSIIGSDPLAPAAPTLALVGSSPTIIESPSFNITTQSALVEGEIISVFNNGATLIGQHTVSAGEAGSGSLNMVLPLLTVGTYNITVTDTITGPHTSQQSNSVQVQIMAILGITIDGGGSAITTGLKGYIHVPVACTISQATMVADQSGSIVVDVFKCTYTQFDASSTHPVSGDKITASAPPTITTATKSKDATLTGWTTAVAADDVLAFNVNSATTITRCTLELKVV